MPDLIGHLPRSIIPSLPSVPAIDGSFLTEFFYSRVNDTIPSVNEFLGEKKEPTNMSESDNEKTPDPFDNVDILINAF